MKPILHYFLKDVRAQRWLLLAWLLILISQMIVYTRALAPDYAEALIADKWVDSLVLVYAGVIVASLILVRVVQKNGDEEVPRWVRVTSLVLFALLLLIAPALVPYLIDAVKLEAGREAVLDILQTQFKTELWLALGVAFLAAWTRNPAQFCLALGIWAVLRLVYLYLFTAAMRFENTYALELYYTRWDLSYWVLCLGVIIALSRQGWKLKGAALALTVTLAIGALFLPTVIPWTFPAYDYTSPHSKLSILGSGEAPELFPTYVEPPENAAKVEFQADWIKSLSVQQYYNTPDYVAQATLTPVLLPGESIPEVEKVLATFDVAGEPQAVFKGGPQDQFQSDAVRGWLGLFPEKLIGYSVYSENVWNGTDYVGGLVTSVPYQPQPISLFYVDPPDTDRLRGKTGLLTIKLIGRKMSLVKRAEIPLVGSHFLKVPRGFIRIDAALDNKRPVVNLWQVGYEKVNRNGFGLAPITSDTVLYEIGPDSGSIYVLEDPEKHHAAILSSQDAHGVAGYNYAPFNGGSSPFFSRWRRSSYAVILRGSEQIANDESFARQVLCIYQVEPTEAFESTLTIPNYRLELK